MSRKKLAKKMSKVIMRHVNCHTNKNGDVIVEWNEDAAISALKKEKLL